MTFLPIPSGVTVTEVIYLYLLLPPPPDDLQLEKKLSPETFFCPELFPLEVKLRLGAVVVEYPLVAVLAIAALGEWRETAPYIDELMA